MEKKIVELFAGVGGFRLGFERLESGWETVWFSQWEPGAKKQWAHECYVAHYGDSPDMNGEYHTGDDVGTVAKESIPDHNLLVGGFPCQDYSVANTLSSAKGIEGKKGVLWWQIRDTIIAKKPPFCLFENVDRLIKSPAKQRGRDFGVILACLNELGYAVEWRVINAATYGAAQRRRRTFIFAYSKKTNYATKMSHFDAKSIINSYGFFASGFPIVGADSFKESDLPGSIIDVSDNFEFNFENAGHMVNGRIVTARVHEIEESPILLGGILESNVDAQYYIPPEKIENWKKWKGAKKIFRKSANGHSYTYSEGAVAFPVPLDRPGRTMLTSEGSLNRCSHVVADPVSGKLRILTPVEAERLQGFDDNWTNTGMPIRMRYFCMGNALVVKIVTRMGEIIDKIIAEEP